MLSNPDLLTAKIKIAINATPPLLARRVKRPTGDRIHHSHRKNRPVFGG
jgi:hypothetical protein